MEAFYLNFQLPGHFPPRLSFSLTTRALQPLCTKVGQKDCLRSLSCFIENCREFQKIGEQLQRNCNHPKFSVQKLSFSVKPKAHAKMVRVILLKISQIFCITVQGVLFWLLLLVLHQQGQTGRTQCLYSKGPSFHSRVVVSRSIPRLSMQSLKTMAHILHSKKSLTQRILGQKSKRKVACQPLEGVIDGWWR